MWKKIIDTWKRFWSTLARIFVIPESEPEIAIVVEDDPIGPDLGTNESTNGVEETPSDVAADIAKAIWVQELADLPLEELDQLAAEFFRNDPEVEIVDEPTGGPEAGDSHGVNESEDDMMGTYDPNMVYEDDGELPEGVEYDA